MQRLLLICLLASCNGPDTFERLMKQEGITQAKNNGRPLFGCSKDDSIFFNFKFEGVKNGKPVKGVVYGSMLKGYTIRYDLAGSSPATSR